MESSLPCLISLVLLLFLSIRSASAGPDFIRTSCNDTLYPALCFATLSPYATSVNNNKVLLAETAISVSLKKSKAAAAHAKRLAGVTTDSKLSSVIQDCASNLKDATDLARKSLEQMKKIIEKGSVESAALEIGNVRTWMSAALTNQGTCIDELKGMADGSGTVQRAGVAKMATSNALALISKIVNS